MLREFASWFVQVESGVDQPAKKVVFAVCE